jgi:hypothetical protein
MGRSPPALSAKLTAILKGRTISMKAIMVFAIASLLGGCVTDSAGPQSTSTSSSGSTYLRADGRAVAEGHLRATLAQCRAEALNASNEYVTAGAPIAFFVGMGMSQSRGDTAMAACMGRNGYYLAQ